MVESVIVSRPAYNEDTFHEIYNLNDQRQKTIKSQVRAWCRQQFTCSTDRLRKIILKFFPVFCWLPKYKKKYIFGDLIAGWTVGIIRIPQGMAYALLAGVQPVFGLYSCFFPVLLWFVFSTSRHTSVGTMAVVCLMIQNLISVHVPEMDISYESGKVLINGDAVTISTVPKEFINMNTENVAVINDSYVTYLQQQQETNKIQVASAATLLVGIIQLIMAVLRLGFLTTLLSDPVIQGFTTGAAFHVMFSQLKHIFGMGKVVAQHTGPFALFKILGDILGNLSQANVADIVISVIALPSLLIVKYLNDRFKKKLRNIPIPIELILVVIATLISYFFHLDKPPYQVNTVKTIPTGLPSVSVPAYIYLWPKMVTDCLIMALISVAISLSLTKIYADKHGYDTDANQEILALGVCNTLPAFLSSFAVAASLSRTAIQESAGGKTQLVSILSSVLMLIVLLWLAPLFEPLPKSLLACIIIVALKSLFLQFTNLKNVWKISKFDFFIWISTCLGVVVLGVDVGLAVGVAIAIGALLFRIQHPKYCILGRIPETDLYGDVAKYKDALEIAGIKIFRFADSVSFTNKDAFRNCLYTALGCNPSSAKSKLKKKSKSGENEGQKLLSGDQFATTMFSSSPKQVRRNKVRNRSRVLNDETLLNDDPVYSILGFNILIFDVTMWSFVDWTASREIIQIIDKFKALDVAVYIAGPSANVLMTLDACGLTSRITHEDVFVSVHDAVVHAEQVNSRMCGPSDGSEDSFSRLPGYPGYDSLAF